MRFEKYTDTAMKAVELAQEEAFSTGRPWVDVQELLVGLVSCGGDAQQLLEARSVTTKNIRAEIERLNRPKSEKSERHLPFVADARDVLEGAQELAGRLEHEHVTTAHMLSALIQNHQSTGAALLEGLGVPLKELGQEVIFRLSEKSSDQCTDKRHAHIEHT